MGGKTALITGITGQDGSYLADFLLKKGYLVYGTKRRASTFNTDRIDHLFKDPQEEGVRLILKYADLTDAQSVSAIIQEFKPDELYNLGAQSHVRVSFDIPAYTVQATGVGALTVLEAIRKYSPDTKFYQASSSEMFGLVGKNPQNELTPFHPRSPYGCAKAFAFNITRNYREAYGTFASNGILFNHESPRRGGTFVTRKITRAIANIKAGKLDKLYLGNLEARRDWGFAPEFVEAMWLILQQDKPDDFVIATGETHSVREFAEKAFKYAGMGLEWKGKGLKEKGIEKSTGKVRIEIDPRYFRPAEVDVLIGDASKAKKILGWQAKVKFDELIRIMVDADIDAVEKGTDYRFR